MKQNKILALKYRPQVFEDLIGQEILTKTNAELYQLPVILRTDPMAKLIRLCPGDICEITRTSEKCGKSMYYRVCK